MAAAKETAGRILSGREAAVRFVAGDMRDEALREPLGSFGYAVCNPPFFERKLNARGTPKSKQQARAEVSLRLPDLCMAARGFLEPGGRFAVCHLGRRARQVKEALFTCGFSVEEEILYDSIRRGDGGIVYLLAQRMD